MRFLLTLSLLLLLAAPSLAAQPRVDRIEIVSAGLFKSKIAKRIASPSSARSAASARAGRSPTEATAIRAAATAPSAGHELAAECPR